MNGEGLLFGPRIAVIEEVYELIHSYRVRIREVPVLDKAPRHSIGRCIHVHRECGEAVILGIDERIDSVMLEEREVVCCVVDRGRTADGVESLNAGTLSWRDLGRCGHLSDGAL